MSTRSFANVLVLCAALLIGAGPYLVRAAGTAAEGAVAQVDLQQVYAASDSRAAAEQRIHDLGRTLYDRFQQTTGLQYLTAKELNDFTDALNASPQTDAQKKLVTDLTAESARRVAEVQALTAKKQGDLTAADQKRMKDLSDIQSVQPQAMAQLQTVYQQLVNSADARETEKGLAEVRDVVTKLAKEKGISEVFDTSCLVVAPVDLTAAAIQKVKKK